LSNGSILIGIVKVYAENVVSYSPHLGLVGDECEDESAEEGDAEAGSQHDVARCEGCFEFGFGLVVHGFEV